jgi:hypothetical protein
MIIMLLKVPGFPTVVDSVSTEEAEQPKTADGKAEEAENALRSVERILERIGRNICEIPGSAATHGRINTALAEVREAIRSCWLMKKGLSQ